jgi:hypothetical protein
MSLRTAGLLPLVDGRVVFMAGPDESGERHVKRPPSSYT